MQPPRSNDEAFPHQAVTGTVIAASHSVFRALGFGFLESVYRRALVVDLRHRSVRVEQEAVYELFHLREPIGGYKADVLVDSRVIVEVKTGLLPDPTAPVQLLNYLCAARLPLGLVIYFGPKGAKAKRVIATDFIRSVDRGT